jgi:hypothetical protein
MTLANAKAKTNETFIVQASLTIVTYDRKNMLLVRATVSSWHHHSTALTVFGQSDIVTILILAILFTGQSDFSGLKEGRLSSPDLLKCKIKSGSNFIEKNRQKRNSPKLDQVQIS